MLYPVELRPRSLQKGRKVKAGTAPGKPRATRRVPRRPQHPDAGRLPTSQARRRADQPTTCIGPWDAAQPQQGSVAAKTPGGAGGTGDTGEEGAPEARAAAAAPATRAPLASKARRETPSEGALKGIEGCIRAGACQGNGASRKPFPTSPPHLHGVFPCRGGRPILGFRASRRKTPRPRVGARGKEGIVPHP